MGITNSGTGNIIDIDPSCNVDENTSFYIMGNNNTVTIGKNCTLEGVGFSFFGDNHAVSIGNNVQLHKGLIGFENHSAVLSIGNNTVFHQGFQFGICEPRRRLTIGHNCLASAWVRIRTTDSHAIHDLSTKQRLNHGKDITIGDRVWIAESVHILKGAQIGNDCVVGAGSIVTGKIFPSNSVIAGNPARVIRSNIYWSEHREDK